MITGAKIREARQALKLTQAQCAEKAGINPSEWSMIEKRAELFPMVERAGRILRAVGMTIQDAI